MSGQGNMIDFEVVGETDDSKNATVISGIPVTSTIPTDGDAITYNDPTKTAIYSTIPFTNLLSAMGSGSFTPVTNGDIQFLTLLTTIGDNITSPSITVFSFVPGWYRLQFSFQKATFGAAGSTERITYQLYDQTAAAGIGPIGEVVGFDANTTTSCGVSIETIVKFTVQTDVSVRVLTVSGTTPLIFTPCLNLMRLVE